MNRNEMQLCGKYILIIPINFNQNPNGNVAMRVCRDLNEFQDVLMDDMLIYQNKLSIWCVCACVRSRKIEAGR